MDSELSFVSSRMRSIFQEWGSQAVSIETKRTEEEKEALTLLALIAEHLLCVLMFV